MGKFLPYANQNFDRKFYDIIIGLGFSSKYEIAEIVTFIKFQLLATKVGNTIKIVGTYWILDSIHWQGYRVPPVTVRGLDHRTKDHSQSPATQSRNHSLLNSSEQDHPAVVISNRTTQQNKRDI